jgi:hypothetical protein
VPLDKRFGSWLAVTLNFLPQGQVQLHVAARRTTLNASSNNPCLAHGIEIGETTANANVVMNTGDTLVLSGLSEKSPVSTRNVAPSLQDAPGIQSLFCNRKTTNLQRSVPILATLRAPEQIAEFADSAPAIVEVVMTQLQGNGFYLEFRQDDVSLERWDSMRSTSDRLKEALGFLHD